MNPSVQENGSKPQLTDDEKSRVDALFSSARRCHYWAFLCAGLSILLSMLGREGKFILPFGGVEIPSTQASVALYLTAIILVAGADRFSMLALAWSDSDDRRPPFAWIALGIKGQHHLILKLWLALPLIACSIGTALTLHNDVEGAALAYCGVFAAFLPRVMATYMHHIVHRTDVRGGPTTFSIYLLYWLRLFRQLFLTAALFLPVLAVITPYRDSTRKFIAYSWAVAIGLHLVRMGGSFVYKPLDRLGGRLGFPTSSRNY